MKYVAALAVSFCALFSGSVCLADTVQLGLGVDNAAGLGEHVTAQYLLSPEWNLGLQLGQHAFRADKADMDKIYTEEYALSAQRNVALTTNVGLYQSIAIGQVKTPTDASVSAYNTIDIGTGLHLTSGKMFTDVGLGLRDNLIDAPVRIGVGAVTEQYVMYPSVTMGVQF